MAINRAFFIRMDERQTRIEQRHKELEALLAAALARLEALENKPKLGRPPKAAE